MVCKKPKIFLFILIAVFHLLCIYLWDTFSHTGIRTARNCHEKGKFDTVVCEQIKPKYWKKKNLEFD